MHTERIRPPRALWVPFELGRPFGAPDVPEFQLDVLRNTLSLLARPSGPVLEDYPREAPEVEDADAGWACPIPLPPPRTGASDADRLARSLVDEVARLRPWYEESRRARGRTTLGLSGLPPEEIEAIAEFLARFAVGERPTLPAGVRHEWPWALRFLADDAKAYYCEAVAAQPGQPSPSARRLGRWLFGETVLGAVLFKTLDRVRSSEDAREQRLERVLVPVLHRHLRSTEPT
jgi:hypothetical protein